MQIQPGMIGRQFDVLPSQPPNPIVTDPPAASFAVTLASVRLERVLHEAAGVVMPIDQKPSTGT